MAKLRLEDLKKIKDRVQKETSLREGRSQGQGNGAHGHLRNRLRRQAGYGSPDG